jgi:3-dehydroquinate synthase
VAGFDVVDRQREVRLRGPGTDLTLSIAGREFLVDPGTYAYHTDLLQEAEWSRIINLLRRLGFQLYYPELDIESENSGRKNSIIEGLNEFREHLGGQLTIMLLEGIGRGFETHTMDENQILRSIRTLKEYEMLEEK